jgi:hypothetical protein
MESEGPSVGSKRGGDQQTKAEAAIPAELISFFFVLLKEPKKEHDFKTCPVCKQYGIVEI